jgi:hypothetical protein
VETRHAALVLLILSHHRSLLHGVLVAQPTQYRHLVDHHACAMRGLPLSLEFVNSAQRDPFLHKEVLFVPAVLLAHLLPLLPLHVLGVAQVLFLVTMRARVRLAEQEVLKRVTEGPAIHAPRVLLMDRPVPLPTLHVVRVHPARFQQLEHPLAVSAQLERILKQHLHPVLNVLRGHFLQPVRLGVLAVSLEHLLPLVPLHVLGVAQVLFLVTMRAHAQDAQLELSKAVTARHVRHVL